MELIRHHFDIIDSTNAWAKQHAHEFPRDKMILVTAGQQTAGRGRFKRSWNSPPGQNIYASFCIFLDKRRKDINNLPQVMAISMAKVLESFSFHPEVKWPNDLLLSKKKVGGILAESTLIEEQLCLIIGIGLNINMPESLLQAIDRPATSLSVEAGHLFNIEQVLETLKSQFLHDLTAFISKGFSHFLNEYRRRLFVEPHIRFHDNKIVWEGTLHAIHEDGSISLRLSNDEIKTFVVGEILWPNE